MTFFEYTFEYQKLWTILCCCLQRRAEAPGFVLLSLPISFDREVLPQNNNKHLAFISTVTICNSRETVVFTEIVVRMFRLPFLEILHFQLKITQLHSSNLTPLPPNTILDCRKKGKFSIPLFSDMVQCFFLHSQCC